MRVLGEARLALGEGPGYDPIRKTAWWFDIPNRALYLHDLTQETIERIDLPFAASAMAMTSDGRQLLVAEDGLYLREPATGTITLHLPLEADQPQLRSNDARVHPSGALWIGTMGWQAEPQAGSYYHYFGGQIRKLWGDITIPNATCFSPDGRIAYFADTPTGEIMRVATDPSTGLPLSAPAPFLTNLEGPPDGAVTDAEGNIWVALWGKGKVKGFSPTGEGIGEIVVPASNVTCPAFIGDGAAQILITTARLGLSDDELVQMPLAGASLIVDAPRLGRFDPMVAL